MTRGATLLRFGCGLAALAPLTRAPAYAQVVRVAAGDEVVATAKALEARGYATFPLTLVAALGADVGTAGRAVVVHLFGDTLRFRPGHTVFWVNGRAEPLYAWTFEREGVLFVPQRFFTQWLPGRYPGRLSYGDGTLRIVGADRADGRRAAGADGSASERSSARAAPAPRRDSTRRTAPAQPPGRAPRPAPAPPPDSAERPPARPDSGEQRALVRRDPEQSSTTELMGFVDARVSGVFDSNIDHDPAARSSYGTVGRLAVGMQSARYSPFLMARYDFGLYRFAETDVWNRVTHDFAAELAPSLPPVRLRLGLAVRVGSWTQDRELANQIILRPQVEIRLTGGGHLNVYAAQSARRVGVTQSRRDTNLIAGAAFYHWGSGGRSWQLDARYEVNDSEREASRYTSWMGRGGIQVPLSATDRLRLLLTYRSRRYPSHYVDDAESVARRDNRWTPALSVTRDLDNRRWELELEYELEIARSNDADAAYRAHRFELTLRRRW